MYKALIISFLVGCLLTPICLLMDIPYVMKVGWVLGYFTGIYIALTIDVIKDNRKRE